MGVRLGYKKTEVGLIPEDWDAAALGPHVEIKSGESPSLFRFESEGIPYFKVEELNNNSKYLRDTPYFIRGNRKVPRGSLIFPKRGASILLNKVRILESDSFMDTNLMTLTPKSSINNEFLYYALTHIELWRIADTTSIPQINNKHIVPLKVPLPPTYAEQEVIAKALGDVDALIGGLDQLIAKKRDLKQAAMQQLLTCQTRLPGFIGQWKTDFFEKVFRRINAKDNQIQTSEYQITGAIPVVDQGKEPVVGFSDREEKRSHCPEGGVIVFGDHTCIVKFVDFDFVVGADGTQILATKSGHCTRFHAFQLQLHEIPSTGYNRHFKFLKERVFFSPPLPEQTAIATVLSDMDAEMEALERRLAKTRALKQGMMQELLTGGTRLV